MKNDIRFSIDAAQLLQTGRVILGSWIEEDLHNLSESIVNLASLTSTHPFQHGRVITLRWTDTDRLFSSFKSAVIAQNPLRVYSKKLVNRGIVL